jgi:UDPglucose 6-dehydrogenase
MGGRRITVIGSGYVGTVVAACLAHVGNHVVGVETDRAKLSQLSAGIAPFREPGLDHLLAEGLAGRALRFTDESADALADAEVIFICVGTPPGPDGAPDMTAMFATATDIARNLRERQVIVTKSTVPVGTGNWLANIIAEMAPAAERPLSFSVVSNPEFLREGSAVSDYLCPERVVVGCDDPNAAAIVADIYRPILEGRFSGERSGGHVPLVRTGLTTAELIKYASNAFLATKISFANEVARLCDHVGADVTEVVAGMGLDRRIGHSFLDAGLGWGGSCFGKDLAALVETAGEYRYRPRILQAAIEANDDQRQYAVDQLLRYLKQLRGSRIALFGLSFKPGTDDLRDAPAVDVARRLLHRGASVRAFDPVVTEVPELPDLRTFRDPYTAAAGADAVVVATEWPAIVSVDLTRLREACRGDLFFDGRNCFDPGEVRRAGFEYLGVGRSAGRREPLDAGHARGQTHHIATSTPEGTRFA